MLLDSKEREMKEKKIYYIHTNEIIIIFNLIYESQ